MVRQDNEETSSVTDSPALPVDELQSLPSREDKLPADEFVIVGIGASAGGLEAFIAFVEALPADTGMGFVLVQHLDRNAESLLADILSARCSIPVQQVHETTYVEANHVYVIPPNATMLIENRMLRLSARPPGRLHTPIDSFFSSLAGDRGTNAIGVVLSGSASDGTLGLKAIKAAGGVTFCQDSSAKFDSMPRSAVSAGAVDYVLPPARIAAEIASLAVHPYYERRAQFTFAQTGSALITILRLLRTKSTVDFAQYKQTTIQRRLGRRLALLKCEDLASYLEVLQRDSDELQALYDDLLINVTEFFRDSAVFAALGQTTLPEILKGKKPGESIRVWVPGCSSGEEVYSLAIVLTEYLEENQLNHPVQIFGTDVSERVLEKARAGVYGQTIPIVLSPERLERFFIRTDAGHQIVPAVREMCLFARQNVAKDPPLSKMDLISCRNLLIYLNPLLQQRVIATFGYSLLPSGCLVLGSSEALGNMEDSFTVRDRDNKIFCRRADITPSSFISRNAPGMLEPYVPVRRETRETGTADPEQSDRLPRKNTTPVGLVLDAELRILEFRGAVEPYLTSPERPLNADLDAAVRSEIAAELRGMTDRALRLSGSVVVECVNMRDGGRIHSVRLTVLPVRVSGADLCFVVLMEAVRESAPHAVATVQMPPLAAPPEADDPQRHIEHLEGELTSTRQYLQTIIEELRSTNEEAQSANEELQSTNEELQTAKEELQSTNEELHTINEEMESRNALLVEVNNDLLNLLSSMNTPVIMTGSDLRIRRFTPSAGAVLNLVPTDIGRPITDFQPRIDVPDLQTILRGVLESLKPFEREVCDAKGGFHLLRVRPYRTADSRIDGVVLQLVDMADIKRSLEEARDASEYVKAIVDTVGEPLLVLDSSLVIHDMNRSALAYFKVTRADVEQRHLTLAGSGFQIPRLLEVLAEVIRTGAPAEEVEVEHDIPGSGRRSLSIAARKIESARSGTLVLVAIRDVTDRKQAAEARYRRLFESAHDGILLVEVNSGTIEDVNPYLTQLLAFNREDFVGHKVWQAEALAGSGDWRSDFERIREHGVLRVQDRMLRAKDGRSVQVEIIANSYAEGNRRVIQFNIRDMTERRKFEQQLQHSAKLESLGLLAGGIAHDFNNLLTGVLGNASLVFARAPMGHPDRPLVREIMRSAERAAHLTRQMLAYAGKGSFLVERTDLATFIPESLPLIQSSIPKTVELRLNLGREVPAIDADPGQLQQVLMNLVINAAESIGKETGYITVQTSAVQVNAESGASNPPLGAQLEPGPYVLLRISDTGCGMDEATRAKIFDPFFTTKFTGRGLGLAAVQGIIRAHRGSIRVESTPGKGTTFEVLFPPAPPEAPAAEPLRQRRKLAGRGLVLVVDDEDAVRNVAKIGLEWAGYETVVAENGQVAVEIFEQRHNEIRLVLLDLVMPVMGGEEALARMQEIRPGIPILLISGFDEAEAMRRFGLKRFSGFLQKPFTIETLKDEISAALD